MISPMTAVAAFRRGVAAVFAVAVVCWSCSRSTSAPGPVPLRWAANPRLSGSVAPPAEVADGLDVELFAGTPLLLDPIAISVDDRGRLWIADRRGVDIGGGLRVVLDDNRDGVADRSAWISGDPDEVVPIGVNGVLALGPDLWWTRGAELWRGSGGVRDPRSFERERVAIVESLGGDDRGLTGPVLGPDGRLYFAASVGGEGVVFRCEADGGSLEEFAMGLGARPELAFDADGELFAADGDDVEPGRSRIVHIVRHGRYGAADGCLPGAGFVVSRPMALVRHPGTGFDQREHRRFAVADGERGVFSFGLSPHGASFVVDDVRPLVRGVRVASLAFDPRGALWVADRGDGRSEAARVLVVSAPDVDVGRDVARILSQGFAAREHEELISLLDHADLRVRTRAHLELARRGREVDLRLNAVIEHGASVSARQHALWALAVAARWDGVDPSVLLRALGDEDVRIRVAAARACGELRVRGAVGPLLDMLGGAGTRERTEAALALTTMGERTALGAVLEMVEDGAADDPFVFHAGVEALRRLADEPRLLRIAADEAPILRRAALRALCLLGSGRVADLLDDPDQAIRVEAARAIHESALAAAVPALAERLGTSSLPAAAVPSALEAAFLAGRSEDARRLGAFVQAAEAPVGERVRALRLLGRWAERDPEPARTAVAQSADVVVSARDPELVAAFVEAAAALRVEGAADALAGLAVDGRHTARVRGAALEGLVEMGGGRPVAAVMEAALVSGEPVVVAPALRLVEHAPDSDAVEARIEDLAVGAPELTVRQEAVRAIGAIGSPRGERFLRGMLDQLDELPAGIRLDVIDAAQRHGAESLRGTLADRSVALSSDPLAPWRDVLDGGDAVRGAMIFEDRSDVSCRRCHAVAGAGGTDGPALDGIGADRTGEEILADVLFPRTRAGWSVAMPDVARRVLTLRELRDLIAYLRGLR